MFRQAVTSLSAYKYETTLDEIVDEVTNDMMQPVIVEAWKEVIDSHRDTQITEVHTWTPYQPLTDTLPTTY